MMLAAFYTIQDHLYPGDRIPKMSYSFAEPPNNVQSSGADGVGSYGNSDFLQAIQGKDPADAWKVMDELMDTMRMINERVYNAVMRKLR